MPVPLSVIQAAAQGDRKAMRLVEQEYGVGNGQNYAIDWLSEEVPPPEQLGAKRSARLIEYEGFNPEDPFGKPRVRSGGDYSLEDVISASRPYKRTEYQKQASQQVRKGEAEILADKISRLKKESDIQEVLLKIAGEDYKLAQKTAMQLQIGGGAALGLAGGGAGFSGLGMSAAEAAMGGSALSVPGAFFGLMAGGPGDWSANKANRQFADIKLSPEAQTIYDEYKAKGYSPTYYKTK
tara:strand:+ start:225 stop:938 length:714 start_codon:yes stop_codon:yes gene_type:complete